MLEERGEIHEALELYEAALAEEPTWDWLRADVERLRANPSPPSPPSTLPHLTSRPRGGTSRPRGGEPGVSGAEVTSIRRSVSTSHARALPSCRSTTTCCPRRKPTSGNMSIPSSISRSYAPLSSLGRGAYLSMRGFFLQWGDLG